MSDLLDRIEHVIIFESDEEMEEWLKLKANLAALKQTYSPRKYHCYLNKETRQLTIMKRD